MRISANRELNKTSNEVFVFYVDVPPDLSKIC